MLAPSAADRNGHMSLVLSLVTVENWFQGLHIVCHEFGFAGLPENELPDRFIESRERPQFGHPIRVGQKTNVCHVIDVCGHPILEAEAQYGHLHSRGVLIREGLPRHGRQLVDVQLGGVNEIDYDKLNVTGSAKLNGTLKVYLTNGFIPAAGDSFVVLTTSSTITDSFVTVNSQSGLYLTLKKNSNNVTLVVDSIGTISSVENNSIAEIPNRYELSQNYPNPFNPSTNIQFALPQSGFVKLEIFNITGERVDVLISTELNAGKYNYEWNGSNLTSGIYLYRLDTGSFVETRKMLLIK